MQQQVAQVLTVPNAIKLAIQHHQAGNLKNAEVLYRKVLDIEPNNADALHLLGLVLFQLRNTEGAIKLVQKAISINSRVPAYYSNLGLIFHDIGQPDIAIINYRRALTLNPNYAEAHNNLGTVLFATGQFEEAISSYRRALELRPNYPEAFYNQGIVLKAQGKKEDAISSYRRALELRPAYAEALNNLGFIYQEQGDHNEAATYYSRALEIRPDYPEAHNNIGTAFLAQGKQDEAIASYKKALELRPNYAEAYNNLGFALADQRKYDEAIEAYKKAIALKPDYADAHNNLGISLKDKGRLEEAMECYKKALALSPGFAKAYNNMGIVLQQQGKFDEAIASYMKSIDLQQDFTAAYRNLVNCKKVTEADIPLLEKLERYLETASLAKEDESDLRFALGKINDDLGRYEKAFIHYKSANDYERTKYTFDREQHSNVITRIIETFTPEFFEQRRSFGSESDLPVMVLGMMRSGTTLIEQIISSHPSVFGAGELDFWGEQGKKYPVESSTEITSETAHSIAEEYISYLKSFSPDATYVTDKMPANFLKIGLIHLMFPKARIIHCRRNAIDICLSIYFHKFAGYHPYAYDMENLAYYYKEYERLMRHWRAVLPSDIFFEVQYEELIRDQEGTSKRIIELCGLEWDDKCLSFHEHERPIKTASCWQVRQPIYKSSTARWKNYEPFLGPFAEFKQAD